MTITMFLSHLLQTIKRIEKRAFFMRVSAYSFLIGITAILIARYIYYIEPRIRILGIDSLYFLIGVFIAITTLSFISFLYLYLQGGQMLFI